jgi:anti-sigma regulatory factor (Ser/Thr protein kinase)
MYVPSLTLDTGKEAIGSVQSAEALCWAPETGLVQSLKILHQPGVQGRSIERAHQQALRHWQRSGVSRMIRNHIEQLGCLPTRATLPVYTYEWLQNAIEHGAAFSNVVEMEVLLGREGVLASITDPGDGFDPDARMISAQQKNTALYEAQGYPSGRGYGLHGVLQAPDVRIGFEHLDQGFRVTLLSSRQEMLDLMVRQEAMVAAYR